MDSDVENHDSDWKAEIFQGKDYITCRTNLTIKLFSQ